MPLRRKKRQQRSPVKGPFTFVAIGHVQNDRPKPSPKGWGKVESSIVLPAEHAPLITGFDKYSHAIVVFYMDLAAAAPEKPAQLTFASGHTYGLLAMRSQLRPNHIGVSVVPVLGVEGATLRVRGLDAIDGTPVLDIKPYLPEYDSVPGARIPNA